jgi:hypothetical protein
MVGIISQQGWCKLLHLFNECTKVHAGI